MSRKKAAGLTPPPLPGALRRAVGDSAESPTAQTNQTPVAALGQDEGEDEPHAARSARRDARGGSARRKRKRQREVRDVTLPEFLAEGRPADARLHVAGGLVPGGRQEVKAATAAVRQLSTAVPVRSEEDEAEEERFERVSRFGARGPNRARSWVPPRVQPHQATSNVLAFAYPFQAEAGLGSDGLYIGREAWGGAGFCYDPWVLYAQKVLPNPNVFLGGVVGHGKSALAKALATRSIPFGRRCYVPLDTKGEWLPVADTVGGSVISISGGAVLNPLDEGTRPAGLEDEEWARIVADRRSALLVSLAETALKRDLLPVEHTALAAALVAEVAANEVPILPGVVERIFHPKEDVPGASVAQLREDGRVMGHALNRLVAGDLKGRFDGPSSVALDVNAPMVVVDGTGLGSSDELLAMVATCASSWMEAAILDPAGGQRWVVYDEGWRYMQYPALLRRMNEQWKLARALGIANMLVIHGLTDLDMVGDESSEARARALRLISDCSTQIIYRQEQGDAHVVQQRLQLNDAERDILPTLGIGEGLWRVGGRSFVVQHELTAGELALFKTDTRMVTE